MAFLSSLGRIAYSPDYKTERDMSLPSSRVPCNVSFYSLTDEEHRLIETFRRLRPGQTLEIARDAEGRFWRTADVTEDPC